MRQIATLNQLQDLQNSTWIYAIAVCVIAIVIAYLVSNMIAWQGGNDKSYIKRRVWWVIIGFVAGFGFWIYNDVVNVHRIVNVGFKHMYSQTNLLCLLCFCAILVLACLLWQRYFVRQSLVQY